MIACKISAKSVRYHGSDFLIFSEFYRVWLLSRLFAKQGSQLSNTIEKANGDADLSIAFLQAKRKHEEMQRPHKRKTRIRAVVTPRYGGVF